MSVLNGFGISLKPQHFETILSSRPAVDWFEIHPENYMGDGGPHHHYLAQICEHYPLSMHGVSLSIGSAEGVSNDHLQQLKRLIAQYKPRQFSEHLSWSHWQQHHHHDLLPLPYTHESLKTTCDNINRTQSILNTKMLIENPSTYMTFKHNDYSEPEFINTLCQRTGCGILLDINNIYVSSQNNQFSAHDYLNDIEMKHVGEIHLAGHEAMPFKAEQKILIDNHGSPICPEVWNLYSYFIKSFNEKAISTSIDTGINSALDAVLENSIPAVLIERDVNIPSLKELVGEAQQAKLLTQKVA